jgi:hypothetical protein
MCRDAAVSGITASITPAEMVKLHGTAAMLRMNHLRSPAMARSPARAKGRARLHNIN